MLFKISEKSTPNCIENSNSSNLLDYKQIFSYFNTTIKLVFVSTISDVKVGIHPLN